MSLTDYGGQRYISAVQKGNVVGTQFHPEKSGAVGLAIIGSFLARRYGVSVYTPPLPRYTARTLNAFSARAAAGWWAAALPRWRYRRSRAGARTYPPTPRRSWRSA